MHRERHSIERIGWLRAAVLGANDGIVSTASLLLGVAAASASHSALMIAGVAGWVAGAMSMATGEYVSVSSQADTEKAALAEEQAELLEDYPGEFRELTSIYVHRGLDPALARQVAEKLMAHDALEAHARDELGISSATRARPLQAALASGHLERTGDGGFFRRRPAVWRDGRLTSHLHQSIAPQAQNLSFVSRRRSRQGDGNANLSQGHLCRNHRSYRGSPSIRCCNAWSR